MQMGHLGSINETNLDRDRRLNFGLVYPDLFHQSIPELTGSEQSCLMAGLSRAF